MLNQVMSHTTNKQKTKTKEPQQNMVNHLCQTQQTKKQKTNKNVSTEHAKPGYVTHNEKTKTKTKDPQQNMLSQLMSRRCERREP